jgi:mono/diheme cytochrome c family protein
MKRLLAAITLVFVVFVMLTLVGVAYVAATGLSARAEPGALETRLARGIRRLAVPRELRERVNPVPKDPEAIADGLAHFADHCAVCHANDGSGNTEMGRGMFPRAPDMRRPPTQELTDGELFYIIEHGIRFTGMPAWGDGSAEGQAASWRLVHFIRELPRLTPEQLEKMEALNPKPPDEIRQQLEEERFLSGEPAPESKPATPHKHPGGKP